jgi:hypothetical protein
MDFSVLADRDCLVVFAAVVLCSDRGVEAHKMGYDYGGIAHLTAKGAAGRTGLSQRADPGHGPRGDADRVLLGTGTTCTSSRPPAGRSAGRTATGASKR